MILAAEHQVSQAVWQLRDRWQATAARRPAGSLPELAVLSHSGGADTAR
jgi:hypothetical protein